MPIHGYPGNVITSNAVVPNSGSASGVWTTEQQLQAQNAGNWPQANQILRSLRFNSADSAYLNRTPASAGNRKTWTWSAWIKRSTFDERTLFNANGNGFLIKFQGDNTLEVYNYSSSAYQLRLVTSAVYRDPSAWYHIVFALDTTQATSSNRARVYVNGTEVTAFSTATYPTQNTDLLLNAAVAHYIGTYDASGQYFNGYMTEVNFIDGQALTPSSFGQTNGNTGVWEPKRYSGSYGTNGFYLTFQDNSGTTSTTLGKDYSGNGNNWTPNNFSVSAGAGNDSLVDTPTPYGVDTGAGGEVRGNYATWNPVDIRGTGNVMLSLANGNLQATGISSSWRTSKSTIGMSSGKWYCEATLTSISGTLYARLGLANSAAPTDNYLGVDSNGWAFTGSWSVNDVIGIAFDADAGTLAFYLNNSLQGTSYSGLTSGPYFFAISIFDPTVLYVNFGQRPFAYTAPSGYKALCTQNLPTPTIGATSTTQANDYFNVVLWTGTGGGRTITGVGFQPDFVWGKGRSGSATYPNLVWDAVRGTNLNLTTNNTGAEENAVTGTGNGGIGTSASDGFTIVAGTSTADNLNALSPASTYVAWNWKANGAGSSNTAGSITSTVSANTTSGFSVVTWTGTGSGTATIGHGLGVAPSMIIVKFRNTTSNWSIYHASVGNTKRLKFTTDAEETGSGYWNNTTPTSTVFTLGTDLNQAYNFVAYCFAAVPGYSAFGSYTGNGSSDGPFIFTGFRPAFVLVKGTSAGYIWTIEDNKRDTYNPETKYLQPQASDAEGTFTTQDFVSNGFKIRTTDTAWNGNGITYIYMAFAENPFKYSLAR